MPEVQIIGAAASNYVWAVRVACGEKGVPYRLNEVPPHSPDVTAIHPLGKIPVMRHGEVELAESRAIGLYLDRAFEGPVLMPRDLIEGAKAEQWVSIVNTSVDPILVRQYMVGYLFPGTPDNSPNRAMIEPVLPRVEKVFAMLERRLSESRNLAGASFTLADMTLTPILWYLAKPPESRAFMAASPHVAAYLQRHMERPSVSETIPTRLPGKLTETLAFVG